MCRVLWGWQTSVERVPVHFSGQGPRSLRYFHIPVSARMQVICMRVCIHACACESFPVHSMGFRENCDRHKMFFCISVSQLLCGSLLAKLTSLFPVSSHQNEFFHGTLLILPFHLCVSYQQETDTAHCPHCLGGSLRSSCSLTAGVQSQRGVSRPRLNFHTSLHFPCSLCSAMHAWTDCLCVCCW